MEGDPDALTAKERPDRPEPMLDKAEQGYCGIGIYKPKREMNLGGLLRSARAFDADFVYGIGARWTVQTSSIKSERDVPVFYFETLEQFTASIPVNAELVCVEQSEGAEDLRFFRHPRQAVYLLGSEDNGVPAILRRKHRTIFIPSRGCLNVASAGTVILYDRVLKTSNGQEFFRRANAR